MQSWSWYVQRLRQMSAAEVAWRGTSALRDCGDRVGIALGLHDWDRRPAHGRFPVALSSLPLPLHTGPLESSSPLLRPLLTAADDIVAHRFSFLNLDRVDLGAVPDWNRDYETGWPTPRGYAGAIDYRDVRIAGDVKLVWEPSRHLQLGVLGRAFRATGNTAYADAGLRQIESWIDQCPFGTGMQWRSPLELAIRAINWTWFLAWVAPSGRLADDTLARVLHVLDAHIHDITRKYSRGSSANNHRIGEAAGVFVTCACLPLTRARERAASSLQILEEEILAQNCPDGGNREQAFGYHLFVLQFLLIAGYTARSTGYALSGAYLDRLRAMIDFVDAMTEAGAAPMYGDADDGYVIDLGDRASGGREWLGVGDCLLGRAPREGGEPVSWLFPHVPITATPGRPLHPRAFADSGIYLLQWGGTAGPDAVRLTFDCGPLGFGPLAAHGHADALAFTLRAFGDDIFVDPGTYDYFRYPDWREYFRSTRAHNTVMIDDADQSRMLGPFMWGARAQARCTEWSADGRTARVSGEHDGYRQLSDPVTHQRSVAMNADQRRFMIRDRLTMAGSHRVSLLFHLGERVRADHTGAGRVEITAPGGTLELLLDPRLEVRMLRGSHHPRGGWVSRGYHSLSPSTTLVASLQTTGPLDVESQIVLGPLR